MGGNIPNKSSEGRARLRAKSSVRHAFSPVATVTRSRSADATRIGKTARDAANGASKRQAANRIARAEENRARSLGSTRKGK